MKRFFCIATLIICTMCCTSCFTLLTLAAVDQQNRVMGTEFGRDEARMELTTFQKISDYAALATTGMGDVVCLIAYFDNYYDGLRLSGRFVAQGTYSYVTVTGVRKHVLVYVPKQDVESLKELVKEFLNEPPEVVVENSTHVTI